ncbi:hypothetical protein PHYBOEH_006467, partial [Phytophthora boehmeriae]
MEPTMGLDMQMKNMKAITQLKTMDKNMVALNMVALNMAALNKAVPNMEALNMEALNMAVPNMEALNMVKLMMEKDITTRSNALVGSVLLLGAISSVCGSSSPQIRGVSPSDQAKYLSAEFACVLNGKLTKLPQSRVNDEFCDCDAGQDEPGTSACSHLEQSKFHCENDGFFPEKIHTSRVDDGICDCCDGSDEDLRSPCKNTCSSAAEVVRKKAEERLEVVRAGFTKRQAVVEGDIADYFSSVQDAESSTSKEMQELLLLKERVVMHKEREELREKKHRLEVARQRQAESQSRTSEGGEGVHREHFSDAAEKEAIEELDFEGLDAVRVADDDASMNAPKLDDEVTLPVAQSLREALREIEADINKLEKERDEKRKAAKFDFGPDRAFFALKDNCIEKRIEKYMYKFCAFGEVKQDQTKLGKWDGWVRDESNASSSGEAYVAHTKMKYSGGQKCYKGPERSVVVHLECGVEDEIVSVDEPSTCVYGMVKNEIADSRGGSPRNDLLTSDSELNANVVDTDTIESPDGITVNKLARDFRIRKFVEMTGLGYDELDAMTLLEAADQMDKAAVDESTVLQVLEAKKQVYFFVYTDFVRQQIDRLADRSAGRYRFYR